MTTLASDRQRQRPAETTTASSKANNKPPSFVPCFIPLNFASLLLLLLPSLPSPMLEKSRLLAWLSTLPPSLPTVPPQPGQSEFSERSRKRKRTSVSLSPHRLPSPPFSLLQQAGDVDPNQNAMNPHEASTAPSTPSPNKARRLSLNEDATEVDIETPKGPRVDPSQAPRKIAQPDGSSIASSYASSQMSEQASSTSKKRKRQASHRKQSNLIAIQSSMSHRSFDGDIAPPPALDRLLNDISILGSGTGIISRTQEAVVRTEASTNRQFRWVRDLTFANDPANPTSILPSPPNRDELGSTPSVKTVRKVWSAAFEAETAGHEENQWNRAVHGRLLDIALDDSFEGIGVCSCTTAQILPEYMRSSSAQHNKKVDLCVYINEQSEELDAAILASQTASINHTDHASLIRTPIGLSIETKITGHDWANAVNQITVWLIAQWDSLDDFASGGQQVRPGSSSAAKAGLVFLPGIIVQGHEWWFIAVGRDPDGATVFWSKRLIGSTTSTQGIYQVVAVLQLLARWIKTEYWPWFKVAILKKVLF